MKAFLEALKDTRDSILQGLKAESAKIFRSLVEAGHYFKSPFSISVLVIFAASVGCLSPAFANMAQLNVWGEGLVVSRELVDDGYQQFVVQSQPDRYESDELDTLGDFVIEYNATLIKTQTYSVLSPFSDVGVPEIGSLTKFNMAELPDAFPLIEAGAIDIGQYQRETLGETYFSAIRISPMFSDETNYLLWSWNLHTFDGKDGNAYIPESMARSLLDLSEEDEYEDYIDLIGANITYSLNGKEYNLAIYNIYLEEGGHAETISSFFNSPIITNVDDLFLSNDIAMFCGLTGGTDTFRHIVYFLGREGNPLSDYRAYYLDADYSPSVFSGESEYLVTLNSIASYSVFGDSEALPWVIAFIVLSVVLLCLVIALGILRPGNIEGGHIALCMSWSLLFMLFDGILFAALGSSVVSYSSCNLIFSIFGILGPWLFLLIYKAASYLGVRRAMNRG